jgi:hypothetical protein
MHGYDFQDRREHWEAAVSLHRAHGISKSGKSDLLNARFGSRFLVTILSMHA